MSARSDEQAQTDCGEAFEHDWHGYRTPRGKTKVCDGSLKKRTRPGKGDAQ